MDEVQEVCSPGVQASIGRQNPVAQKTLEKVWAGREMISVKQMKEKHWNKRLTVQEFAVQVMMIDEDADPIFKLWMQKLFIRFFEGMGENSERTIGEWSAEIDAFMDHLLSHQPKPNTPNAFKLANTIQLIPMEQQ